jgi:hypothetical protein
MKASIGATFGGSFEVNMNILPHATMARFTIASPCNEVSEFVSDSIVNRFIGSGFKVCPVYGDGIVIIASHSKDTLQAIIDFPLDRVNNDSPSRILITASLESLVDHVLEFGRYVAHGNYSMMGWRKSS